MEDLTLEEAILQAVTRREKKKLKLSFGNWDGWDSLRVLHDEDGRSWMPVADWARTLGVSKRSLLGIIARDPELFKNETCCKKMPPVIPEASTGGKKLSGRGKKKHILVSVAGHINLLFSIDHRRIKDDVIRLRIIGLKKVYLRSNNFRKLSALLIPSLEKGNRKQS